MSSPISVCPSSLPLGADHTQAVALEAPAGPRPGPARSRLFLGSRRTSFRAGCRVHRLVPLSSRSDLLFFPRACSSFSSLEFPVGLLQTSSLSPGDAARPSRLLLIPPVLRRFAEQRLEAVADRGRVSRLLFPPVQGLRASLRMSQDVWSQPKHLTWHRGPGLRSSCQPAAIAVAGSFAG